jgi:hypothetical protein
MTLLMPSGNKYEYETKKNLNGVKFGMIKFDFLFCTLILSFFSL